MVADGENFLLEATLVQVQCTLTNEVHYFPFGFVVDVLGYQAAAASCIGQVIEADAVYAFSFYQLEYLWNSQVIVAGNGQPQGYSYAQGNAGPDTCWTLAPVVYSVNSFSRYCCCFFVCASKTRRVLSFAACNSVRNASLSCKEAITRLAVKYLETSCYQVTTKNTEDIEKSLYREISLKKATDEILTEYAWTNTSYFTGEPLSLSFLADEILKIINNKPYDTIAKLEQDRQELKKHKENLKTAVFICALA